MEKTPSMLKHFSRRCSEKGVKVIIVYFLSMLGFIPQVFANIVGVETQNFHPTTSGLDFVTVQSSETLSPGFINIGFFLNYAVNSLPYFDNPDTQNRQHFNDTLLSSDINFGVGLLPNWDMGVSLPVMNHQHIKEEGFHGQYSQPGNTEVRFNTKVRLFGDDAGGIATILSVNLNRLQDNPYLGKDAKPTYNIELAGDTSYNKVALGLNLGYRMRSPGEKISVDNPIDPLDDQIIASTAASYHFPKADTKVIFEIFSAWPGKSVNNNTNRAMSASEALLGLKYDVRHNVALNAGLGSELQHGLSSPDWRFYAGLNWVIGPSKKPKEELQPVLLPPPTRPDEPKEQFVVHDILFEFDSANLVSKGSFTSLRKLAGHLTQNGKFRKVVVEGHTDSIGTDAYNEDLSHRRALTIKTWLTKQFGISSEKIVAVGKGESEPIADNGNYQGRQLNRRVVFKIYY